MHCADVCGDFHSRMPCGMEAAEVMALARLALCALLCGCATTVVREEPANPAIAEALLDCERGTTVQMAEGAWKDEAFAAECVLKGDGDSFTAVLLAPQVRLVTLTIERPHTVRWERAPHIPAALDPERVMLDIAFVRLPTDVLVRALGDGYRVDETPDGKRRRVVDAKSGKLCSVRQVLPDGGVYFRNARYGYEFTVRAVADED